MNIESFKNSIELGKMIKTVEDYANNNNLKSNFVLNFIENFANNTKDNKLHDLTKLIKDSRNDETILANYNNQIEKQIKRYKDLIELDKSKKQILITRNRMQTISENRNIYKQKLIYGYISIILSIILTILLTYYLMK
tara:strand:+ start:439 stop:852 length:414 start_codon:yes stop_codon:yes gene_type:complete